MKPGWTTVALGDIATRTAGRVGSTSGIPIYAVTKHAGFVRSDEYFKKRVHGEDVSKYRRVESGDFAYATIHLDEGSIGVAPEVAAISPMYTSFRMDDRRVDADYLIRFLKAPQTLARYRSMGRGSVHRRRSISFSTLSNLEVPLPPLDEQRRIAAALDRATVVIGGIGDLRRRTRSIGESVVQQSSTGAGRWSTIGESLTLRSGSTLPATRRRPGGVPVYGANGAIGEHDEATHEQPHVTIGRVGAVGAVNVTAGRAWISDNALIVVKAPEHLSNGYLAIALAMADLGRFASQSAQPLITQRKVADVPLWIPSQAEALRIDAILDRLAEVERANVERAARADALFASLQSRAFRGEL